MDDFLQQVRKIAADLLNLEVNTILKDSMTGEKMPQPSEAMAEMADLYEKKLGLSRTRALDGVSLSDRFRAIESATETPLTETRTERAFGPVSIREDDIMLARMGTMSSKLRAVATRIGNRAATREALAGPTEPGGVGEDDPVTFTASDILLIRKAWELGDERIVMQTVIQLDGDVVTRIQPTYASEEFKTLHAIHNQSIVTAVGFWNQLIGIVADTLKSMLGALFGKA
jgi:hypothetical protein